MSTGRKEEYSDTVFFLMLIYALQIPIEKFSPRPNSKNMFDEYLRLPATTTSLHC